MTVMRWIVVGLLTAHGLIHLIGVAKAFGWAEVKVLKGPIGTGAGVLWLLAAVFVLSVAVMIAAGAPSWWWAVALAAAVISQAAIITNWSDAKVGTVANVLLLLVAGYGFVSQGPNSFEAQFRNQATGALAVASAPTGIVSDAEVDALPAPVADYVRRSGAVGQPHVRSFHVEMHGRIRSGPDEAWMPYTVRQLNTYGPHSRRLFLMEATRSGLPVRVFHSYDEHATMRGRVLDVVPVVNAGGDEMDRSETVTLLNDVVLFAPGALVDAPIAWTNVTATTADATYTRGDQTITARLVFDHGDLVDFISDDRMRASGDGRTFRPQRWNTPVSGYADFGRFRVAAQGLGMWSAPKPEGHFAYIELVVDDLAYNVDPGRVRR